MPVGKATFVFQRALKSNFSFFTTFSALFNNRSFIKGTPRSRNSAERREVTDLGAWVAATTFIFQVLIHTCNTHFVLLSSAEVFLFLKSTTPHRVHQREGFYNYHSLNECPEHTDNVSFLLLEKQMTLHPSFSYCQLFFIKTSAMGKPT